MPLNPNIIIYINNLILTRINSFFDSITGDKAWVNAREREGEREREHRKDEGMDWSEAKPINHFIFFDYTMKTMKKS